MFPGEGGGSVARRRLAGVLRSYIGHSDWAPAFVGELVWLRGDAGATLA